MAALSVSREDQERLKMLLKEAVTVLCRNGLSYSSHVMIDGLLGITVDNNDVFLVKFCETVSKSDPGSDFSQVSELLGAARNNFGLTLNADGSSPLPLHSYNGKDVNDNHTTPAAINIAPISDLNDALVAARRGGKRSHGSLGSSSDHPMAKRSHIIRSEPQTETTPLNGGVGRIGQDEGGNIVIKSEPLDSDEEVQHQPQFDGRKALGVISTVPASGNFHSSHQNASYQDYQPESQDSVLNALRAALITKLANNNNNPSTPQNTKPQNNNNNNDSPSVTPTPSSGGSGKKRKVLVKAENENEVTLKCLMCTYETNRRYNFIRHMRGHSKSYAIYACDLCGDRFHSEEELGAHGLEAHKGHHLTCDQCGMTFMSERGKNIHAKTHKMMPIPEKKSVECETQCTQNDLEESMAQVDSTLKDKVMSASSAASGAGSDDESSRYRTLREQLSSRTLVIRFPVLNGKVQSAASEGKSKDNSDQDTEEDEDQPADLSLSKSLSTSTSPPPLLIDTEADRRVTRKESSTKPMMPADLSISKSSSTSTSTSTSPPPPPQKDTEADKNIFTAIKEPSKKPILTAVKEKSVLGNASPPPNSTAPKIALSSALSAALAAAKPVATSTSPTPGASASEGEHKPKEKSRKQHSTQIVRLVTVKKEPHEA